MQLRIQFNLENISDVLLLLWNATCTNLKGIRILNVILKVDSHLVVTTMVVNQFSAIWVFKAACGLIEHLMQPDY